MSNTLCMKLITKQNKITLSLTIPKIDASVNRKRQKLLFRNIF